MPKNALFFSEEAAFAAKTPRKNTTVDETTRKPRRRFLSGASCFEEFVILDTN
jgi:hypothetical protein